jgi:hypothetical protein
VGNAGGRALTPMAPPAMIGPLGGLLTRSGFTVTVAPDAVSSDMAFTLTALSAQGLPGLLPLGYSPLLAFDLRADVSLPPSSLTLGATGLPDGPLHLVEYRSDSHGWYMAAPGITAENGVLTAPLPGRAGTRSW